MPRADYGLFYRWSTLPDPQRGMYNGYRYLKSARGRVCYVRHKVHYSPRYEDYEEEN